jgi:hypothetical protein
MGVNSSAYLNKVSFYDVYKIIKENITRKIKVVVVVNLSKIHNYILNYVFQFKCEKRTLSVTKDKLSKKVYISLGNWGHSNECILKILEYCGGLFTPKDSGTEEEPFRKIEKTKEYKLDKETTLVWEFLLTRIKDHDAISNLELSDFLDNQNLIRFIFESKIV